MQISGKLRVTARANIGSDPWYSLALDLLALKLDLTERLLLILVEVAQRDLVNAALQELRCDP